MKVILSRKGFDSEYGGCPSPILPDGTLLSMPIPDDSGISFDAISFREKTYLSIWNDLNPNKEKSGKYAHLDPDIRTGIRVNTIPEWKPIFGQCSGSETHLENQGVKEGDLFLFFGWFRETELIGDTIKYKKGTADKHIIYGYLQVGEIITGNRRHDYYWHPHSEDYDVDNNTMYIASDKLVIKGEDTGYAGFGTLNYSESLVLTKSGYSRSRWELPDFFKDVYISHHTKNSFKNGYFQSACKGQEFVVSENDRVTEWAKKIIVENR